MTAFLEKRKNIAIVGICYLFYILQNFRRAVKFQNIEKVRFQSIQLKVLFAKFLDGENLSEGFIG